MGESGLGGVLRLIAIALPSKRLCVEACLPSLSQRWSSACCASIRFCQSTVSSLETNSFASAEIGSQYGERNLYCPALILRNIWLSLSP